MAVNRNRNTATAQRRQKQIEDCLYENLLHTPWQSISVADICRQVGISRKAYYNYYRDKVDCFSSYLYRVLHEAALHTAQSLSDNATDLEAAMVMLDYWKGQKQLLDVIVKNELLNLLIVCNIQFAMTEDQALLELLSTPHVKSDTDILACYTGVQMSLMLSWYGRGFDTPTEEMARKFLRILYEPMLPKAE